MFSYNASYTQHLPIMQARWKGCILPSVLAHAKADILSVIPLHRPDSAYVGKLMAELDAIRDAEMALRAPLKRKRSKPFPARKAALRCPHCGAENERAGHQDCAYPQDMQ